jgi:hypothetical protein
MTLLDFHCQVRERLPRNEPVLFTIPYRDPIPQLAGKSRHKLFDLKSLQEEVGLEHSPASNQPDPTR